MLAREDLKCNFREFNYTHTHRGAPWKLQGLCLMHTEDVCKCGYVVFSRTDSTSTLLCTVTARHPTARALPQPRRAPRLLVSRLQRLYFNHAAHLGASARRAARRRLLRPRARPGATTRRAARRRLLRLAQACRRLLHPRCASGCLGTSRGSSSTTSPRADSSSTTSPTPRVRVPRHIARLVVDYFADAVRPGASARHAARRVARRRPLRLAQACCRLLR
jgi:hypothetical protein